MGHLSEQRFTQYRSSLKEKNIGYAISQSRRPRGFVQVHIQGRKGKLSLRIKNLRQLNDQEKKEQPHYEVLLISTVYGKPVKMGPFEVDSRGEGEGHWDFSADNLKNTGCSIDDFERVLVVARENGNIRNRGKVVLSGDLELEMAEPFDGLNMEKVDPFGPEMPNHRWWKFYPNHFFAGAPAELERDHPVSIDMPIEEEVDEIADSEINPGAVFRGHQLIGLHYDEKGAVSCLVHGIPGRFCAEDQPDRGTSGYIYWQPLPGQSYKEGHYGYWLVHIDPENGEVVYPRQPTPPPDKQSE